MKLAPVVARLLCLVLPKYYLTIGVKFHYQLSSLTMPSLLHVCLPAILYFPPDPPDPQKSLTARSAATNHPYHQPYCVVLASALLKSLPGFDTGYVD